MVSQADKHRLQQSSLAAPRIEYSNCFLRVVSLSRMKCDGDWNKAFKLGIVCEVHRAILKPQGPHRWVNKRPSYS